MAVNVSPGINIKIHVTSDTDGLATKDYVAEQVGKKGLPDGGANGQIIGKVGDKAQWIDTPSGGAEVDATLTQEGKAADAKAVGDKIGKLSKEIDNIKAGGSGGDSNLTTGQYDVSAYVRNGKPSYVLVPHGENVSLHPVDVYADSGVSANNLYYVKEQFAQSGQDGAFIQDKIFRFNESGSVRITDASNGTVLQTMTLDKSDVLIPHANSVSAKITEQLSNEMELSFENGSYTSHNGAAIDSTTTCRTGIFPIWGLSGLWFSVTNKEFLVSCYNVAGAYLGQVSTTLDGLIKNEGQWHAAGTVITDTLIQSISDKVALIGIVARIPETTTPTEYTAEYIADKQISSITLTFEKGSYAAATGLPMVNDRSRTEIFSIAPYREFVTSITNKRFSVLCYDSAGTYLGEVATTLDALLTNEAQWLPPKTVITDAFLRSLSSEVSQIAIVAETPESSSITAYVAEYLANSDTDTPQCLLYANIYNNYKGDTDKRLGECCVYSIEFDGVTYSNSLVQIIKIGFTDDANLWASASDERRYGNFVVDGENNKLYVFVGETETKFFEFLLPDPSDGVYNEVYGCPVVTLTESDIIRKWTTDPLVIIQGACCHDGKLWCTTGFGTSAYKAVIHIVDIEKQCRIAGMDLNAANIAGEPEFIDFCDNRLYYGDLEHVYTITLC